MVHKKLKINFEGKTYEIEVSVKDASSGRLSLSGSIEGRTYNVNIETGDEERSSRSVQTVETKQKAEISETKTVEPSTHHLSREGFLVKSPLPGKVLAVKVAPQSKVSRGDVLVILESMKMENEIVAPRDGAIMDIKVSVGSSLNINDPILVIV